MNISIQPINCNGFDCRTANVSLAVSNSIALRLVPVDEAGAEYPDFEKSIVGEGGDPAIATFLATLRDAVTTLAAESSAVFTSTYFTPTPAPVEIDTESSV